MLGFVLLDLRGGGWVIIRICPMLHKARRQYWPICINVISREYNMEMSCFIKDTVALLEVDKTLPALKIFAFMKSVKVLESQAVSIL